MCVVVNDEDEERVSVVDALRAGNHAARSWSQRSKATEYILRTYVVLLQSMEPVSARAFYLAFGAFPNLTNGDREILLDRVILLDWVS